jgi:hypothetical protein
MNKKISTSELREGHQTIALLAGGIAVLGIGMATLVMAVSARSYTPRQIVSNLLAAASVAFGFYLALLLIHVLQHVEGPAHFEEERRRAQYERFLDLLRDVKLSLLNR